MEEKKENHHHLSEIGLMLAGVAHELKNPIHLLKNYIISSSLLLDDYIATPHPDDLNDIKHNLTTMMEQVNRADTIIKTVLLSFGHSTGYTPLFEKEDILKIIDINLMIAFHTWRAVDSQFNITIEKDYPENLAFVDILPAEFGRAILSLCDNALYAIYEKKKGDSQFQGILSLRVKEEGGLLTITVKDNGTGIAKEHLGKLFEPFFSTKESGKGTGLGLALARKTIVELHGGTLTCESDLGQGSSFHITFKRRSETP